MNSKELVRLRRKIGLLGRMSESMSFIYSASDSDGFPSLLVDEHIPATEIVALRRRALNADFVRGSLTRDQKGVICFHVQKGGSDSLLRLRTHLDGVLQEQIPALQGALIKG